MTTRTAGVPTDGGLDLGTTWTSLLFLVTIMAVVIHPAVSGRDHTPVPSDDAPRLGR